MNKVVTKNELLHRILMVAEELTAEAKEKWDQNQIRFERQQMESRSATQSHSSRIVNTPATVPRFEGVITEEALIARVVTDSSYTADQVQAALAIAPEEMLERKKGGGLVLTQEAKELLENEAVQFLGGMTTHLNNGIAFTQEGKAALDRLTSLLGKPQELGPSAKMAFEKLIDVGMKALGKTQQMNDVRADDKGWSIGH